MKVKKKIQFDVGSEPYLSTAQTLCLLISHILYYKSRRTGIGLLLLQRVIL